MKDEHRTKEQLVNELVELRQGIAELEAAETKRTCVEKAYPALVADFSPGASHCLGQVCARGKAST